MIVLLYILIGLASSIIFFILAPKRDKSDILFFLLLIMIWPLIVGILLIALISISIMGIIGACEEILTSIRF